MRLPRLIMFVSRPATIHSDLCLRDALGVFSAASNPQRSAGPMHIREILPICGWLPSYERSSLRPDLVAGITLAAFAIPVSLAYASLAGLPTQMGLYCYLVGGLGYALLGTSRHL